MMVNGHDALKAIAIGVGASLLMDLWNLLLRLALGIPSLNNCFLGRWLLHMRSGTFRHASIAGAQPKALECMVGWGAHYTIGAGLGIGFLFLVPRAWLAQPTFLPALLWGIGTLVLPLFVMQPALGLGVASSKTANPTRAKVKSLASHTVFGVGLYLCANAVNYLT